MAGIIPRTHIIGHPAYSNGDLGYLWGNSSCASGSSCKSSCGNSYEQCWDSAAELKKKSGAIDSNLLAVLIKANGVGIGCYNPNQGETCCKPGGLRLTGSTCQKGYFCAEAPDVIEDGLFCCKDGLSLAECEAEVVKKVTASKTYSTPPSTLRRLETATSTSTLGTNNAGAASEMTEMTKIGLGVGVPLATVVLAAVGCVLWRMKRRRKPEKPKLESSEKQTPQWEVDADESALTREQYAQRRKDAAVELNGVHDPVELEAGIQRVEAP